MKALILAMSSAGYGETLIGLSLAQRIRASGWQTHFVIDASSESLLRGSGLPFTALDATMGPLAALIVDEVIAKFRPQIIVLSDYFTYCGVFAKRFGLDPWFIERYQLPIVPIDIWEWEEAGFAIDVFCGKRIQVSERIRTMPAYLRPVPLCHPERNGNPKAFPFSLNSDVSPISNRTRKHLRTTLGLGAGDRLVVLTVARWQIPDYSDRHGNRIAANVPELLAHYLKALPSSVHIATVGQRAIEPALVPHLTVHHIPACAPDRFNVLLGSADLFVGLNIAATTLTRAVAVGVPGLVLVNSHAISKRRELPSLENALRPDDFVATWLRSNLPVYPFRMWPLGFHEFLNPLLANNPYVSTFAQAELFDQTAVTESITTMLFDPAAQAAFRDARAGFELAVAKLRSAEDVFADVARLVGIH